MPEVETLEAYDPTGERLGVFKSADHPVMILTEAALREADEQP